MAQICRNIVAYAAFIRASIACNRQDLILAW